MDGIVDVGAHAPVQVLSGVYHPLAGIGRPPFGHRGGIGNLGCGPSLVDKPGGLEQGDSHAVVVDVAICRSHGHTLVGGQRASELLSLRRVGRGHGGGLVAAPQCHRGHRHLGPYQGPLHNRTTVGALQPCIISDDHRSQLQLAVKLSVCGLAQRYLYPFGVEVHHKCHQAIAVSSSTSRHHYGIGHPRGGNRRFGSIQFPGPVFAAGRGH